MQKKISLTTGNGDNVFLYINIPPNNLLECITLSKDEAMQLGKILIDISTSDGIVAMSLTLTDKISKEIK